MAWTEPEDAPGAANPLPNAWLNTNVRDNLNALKAAFRPNVIRVEVADSPYTWNKPTGLLFIRIRMVGGGGGGGGADTNNSAGGGGGSGGYDEKIIDAADLGSSETVTIGAGGSAGSATGGNGGTGGTTSFGAHASCDGGDGGGGTTGVPTSGGGDSESGGAGGAVTDADSVFQLDGEPGEDSIMFAEEVEMFTKSGKGGSNPLGQGGSGRGFNGTDRAGLTGSGFGSGGSGAIDNDSTGTAGGAGAPGCCIIEEYILA